MASLFWSSAPDQSNAWDRGLESLSLPEFCHTVGEEPTLFVEYGPTVVGTPKLFPEIGSAKAKALCLLKDCPSENWSSLGNWNREVSIMGSVTVW